MSSLMGSTQQWRESWVGFAASTLHKHRLWEVRKKTIRTRLFSETTSKIFFELIQMFFDQPGKKVFLSLKNWIGKMTISKLLISFLLNRPKKRFLCFGLDFWKRLLHFWKDATGSALVLLSGLGQRLYHSWRAHAQPQRGLGFESRWLPGSFLLSIFSVEGP